jgi:hypothetical protein
MRLMWPQDMLEAVCVLGSILPLLSEALYTCQVTVCSFSLFACFISTLCLAGPFGETGSFPRTFQRGCSLTFSVENIIFDTDQPLLSRVVHALTRGQQLEGYQSYIWN